MANNLADRFEQMADVVPSRVALVDGDERVTFGELERRANQLAHHLADHRVGPGLSVGWWPATACRSWSVSWRV